MGWGKGKSRGLYFSSLITFPPILPLRLDIQTLGDLKKNLQKHIPTLFTSLDTYKNINSNSFHVMVLSLWLQPVGNFNFEIPPLEAYC